MKNNTSCLSCSSTLFAKGYCVKHYQHIRRYGRILSNQEISEMRSKSQKTSSRKYKPAWNRGIKWLAMTGANNPLWSGDDVSYRSLHKWVERHKGKSDTCDNCHLTGLSGHKIHWSNISGKYKRDLADWQRLCASCHGAYDSGKLKLEEIGG